jgi:hypothetical protein
MKPTCPNTCPLKQRMDQHKKSEETIEKLRWTMEQLSPFEQHKVLAHTTFLFYRHKGLTKFSTWLEMLERRQVLYFIWGFFERIDFAMTRGR